MKRNARAQVKRWMREHDMAQGRVADRIGVAQGSLSLMLQGRANVSLVAAIKLSELTGIPAADLVSDPKALELVESYVTRQNQGAGNAR